MSMDGRYATRSHGWRCGYYRMYGMSRCQGWQGATHVQYVRQVWRCFNLAAKAPGDLVAQRDDFMFEQPFAGIFRILFKPCLC